MYPYLVLHHSVLSDELKIFCQFVKRETKVIVRPFTYCNFTYRLHAYIFSCLVLSSVGLGIKTTLLGQRWVGEGTWERGCLLGLSSKSCVTCHINCL